MFKDKMSIITENPFSPDKFPKEPIEQVIFLYNRAFDCISKEDIDDLNLDYVDDLNDIDGIKRDLRLCFRTFKRYVLMKEYYQNNHKLLYSEYGGFEVYKVKEKIRILIKIIDDICDKKSENMLMNKNKKIIFRRIFINRWFE